MWSALSPELRRFLKESMAVPDTPAARAGVFRSRVFTLGTALLDRAAVRAARQQMLQRNPGRERPRAGVMLVVDKVSSRKISRRLAIDG